MKVCPECGHKHCSDDIFCARCVAERPQKESRKKSLIKRSVRQRAKMRVARCDVTEEAFRHESRVLFVPTHKEEKS